MGSRHHYLPGNIRAGSREVPVKPGDKTVVAIKNLQAGTTVTMLNGTEVLTPKPLTADEKGNLNIPLTVPTDAATGLHLLTVITQNPASVSQVMLKLSRIVPPKTRRLSGYKQRPSVSELTSRQCRLTGSCS